MLIWSIPKFNKGGILTVDLLQSLRDYPREFVELFFKGYSDGIISGVEVTVNEDNVLNVEQGLIKHKGQVYHIKEKFSSDLKEFSGRYVLKFVFSTEEVYDTVNSYAELQLTSEDCLKENEFEIGRFSKDQGAKLRFHFSRIEELDSYNILDIRYVKHSVLGSNPSISPKIVQAFSKEFLDKIKENGSSLDYCFAFQNFNEKVSKDIIESYINIKLNLDEKSISNIDAYIYLRQILNLDLVDEVSITNNRDINVKKESSKIEVS